VSTTSDRGSRLAGKTALVTGAGSIGDGWGNGKAAAVLFAREGARVVAVDRNPAAAQATVELIESDGGIATAVAADVSKADEVEAAVANCVDEFGSLDVLHNNVGIGVLGGVVEASEESFDLVHRVNLKSMFLTCKHAIPRMLDGGGGAIVNVSSLASMRWAGYAFVSYATSKAAVNALTQTVASEYAARGIRCNAVVPGLMDTPTVYAGLKDHHGDDAERLRRERAALCPMGRMGDAWDVAYAALYLASDAAKYVSGALLVVDGGLSLGVVAPAHAEVADQVPEGTR
jgi:NAD(P)-dependent dehydrogenase (short-subunit alcohol dehydrogenase family)